MDPVPVIPGFTSLILVLQRCPRSSEFKPLGLCLQKDRLQIHQRVDSISMSDLKNELVLWRKNSARQWWPMQLSTMKCTEFNFYTESSCSNTPVPDVLEHLLQLAVCYHLRYCSPPLPHLVQVRRSGSSQPRVKFNVRRHPFPSLHRVARSSQAQVFERPSPDPRLQVHHLVQGDPDNRPRVGPHSRPRVGPRSRPLCSDQDSDFSAAASFFVPRSCSATPFINLLPN